MTPHSDTILFAFEGETKSPAWHIVNDDVMGGVSTSRFQVLANGGAVFSGVVSLENNGGFASVRSSPVRHALDGAEAFVLRVRGDGRRYTFLAKTGTGVNAPNYQAGFTTTRGLWEEHRLPCSALVPTFRGRIVPDVPPLNPGKVISVGLLIADRQEGPFTLELAWIKAMYTVNGPGQSRTEPNS